MAVAVGGATGASARVASPADAVGVTCVRSTAQVAPAAGEPASYTVAGYFCSSPVGRRAPVVQFLLHGGTYNHDYWDFGTVGGLQYSYLRQVAAAGIPTFAIDQIGAGASSLPPSSDVTLPAAAYVAHEVIQGLKGLPGGATFPGIPRFTKVVEVGHSSGSQTAWLEAIDYPDADGLIVTGALHHETDALGQYFYPAVNDPKFASGGYDGGYLTTEAGTRGAAFYNAADADPAVLSSDEQRKDVLSEYMFAGPDLATTDATATIRVPILTIVGSKDAVNCDATYSCASGRAVAQEEATDYSAAAKLVACVVPNSGHSIALHLNAWLEVYESIAWTRHYINGQAATPAVPSAGSCAAAGEAP
jgi:pimeloyl-ACP methyl ester carboxylesterase